MNLAESKTIQNLMRAFAGESQARNRYDLAAGHARNEKLPVVEAVFRYTAGQEYEHAGIFFKHMRAAGLTNIEICGGYPVDLQCDSLHLLRDASHNEFEEEKIIYPDFARVAQEEGFPEIALSFQKIAPIEASHGERFEMLAKWIEGGLLFSSNGRDTRWVCLNCGHIHEGSGAPNMCPVCQHEQGYFIREEFAPFARG